MPTVNLNDKLAFDQIQEVDIFLQQQIDDINQQIGNIGTLDTRVTNIEVEQIQQNNDISQLQTDITQLTLNNSLTDVDITGLVANKILKYDGSKWIVSDDSNGIADVPNDAQNYI